MIYESKNLNTRRDTVVYQYVNASLNVHRNFKLSFKLSPLTMYPEDGPYTV